MVEQPSSPSGRDSANRLIVLQAVAVLLFSALGTAFVDKANGLLLFLGGAIAVVPNFAFTSIAFFRERKQGAGITLLVFCWAEVIKLMLTVIMFIATYVYLAPEGPFLLLGFTGAILCHWLASFSFQPKHLE